MNQIKTKGEIEMKNNYDNAIKNLRGPHKPEWCNLNLPCAHDKDHVCGDCQYKEVQPESNVEVTPIEDLGYAESNNPNTAALVEVSTKNNVNNYKFYEHSNKIGNLLAVGGTVIVQLAYSELPPVTVKSEDTNLIKHCRLVQLEYLFRRYPSVTDPFYAKLAYETFGNRTAATQYFNSKEWLAKIKANELYDIFKLIRKGTPLVGEAAKKCRKYFKNREVANIYFNSEEWEALKPSIIWKNNVLDTEYYNALLSFEDIRQQNLEDFFAKKALPTLRTEAVKAGVYRNHWEAEDIPMNQVTPLQLPRTDYTAKGKARTKYELAPNADFEAKVVNIWLNRREEFYIPTLDDQIAELKVLREWFEQYKYNARRAGVAKPQATTVAKFERLEFLEIEVGPCLEKELREYNLAGETSYSAYIPTTGKKKIEAAD